MGQVDTLSSFFFSKIDTIPEVTTNGGLEHLASINFIQGMF